MSCSGLANVLSGVALMCGPVGIDLPSGSYRDRHGPSQVVDRNVRQSIGEWRLSAEPLDSTRRRNGCYRRVSPVHERPGEGPLTEPRAGAQPRRLELVFMPPSRPLLRL